MTARRAVFLLGLLLSLVSGACGGDGGSSDPDASRAADAAPSGPDADVSCMAHVVPRHVPGTVPTLESLYPGQKVGPVDHPRLQSRPLAEVDTGASPRLPGAVASAKGERRTGLRSLILAPTEDAVSYLAARAAFERIGAPFDVLVATAEELTLDSLYAPNGDCRYAGIVLANHELVYEDPATGEYVTAFSPEEWDRLALYEASCHAREAVWYAYPGPDYGLEFVESFDGSLPLDARLTADGASFFDYLSDDMQVAIEHVYGYHSVVTDPDTTVPLFETTSGDVLGVLHTRADDTEVLALTLDSGAFSTHSQLLEYGIINWLHRGVFLGKRRVYLAPQIDDVFLHTDLWTHDGSEATYRMSAEDVVATADWQAGFQARLPQGSDYITAMGFNGAGSVASIDPDTAPIVAFRMHEQDFDWVNHTWEHTNMDEMSMSNAVVAISNNCQLASEWQLTRFDCENVITPQISGLDNLEAVNGMLAAGVRYAVSDTSETAAFNPENPGDNPSHNVGRNNPWNPDLFQIPRHPTNIFYSTSTIAEQIGLYNQLYSEYFGGDLSYEEMLEQDTKMALSYLLTYDADPLMFHQANLRFVDRGNASPNSLFSDWMDLLADRYMALVDLPVLTLDQSQLAELMQAREAYDTCGVQAWLHSVDGQQRLELESIFGCTVPITGLDAPEAGTVETYAGVPTTHVTLDACNSATIEL